MSFGRILGALFGTASGKGYMGEAKVSVTAWLALPKSTYTPFHDVTLPTPDGTTQIDHIFVSRFGIFVVETKNMGGWIFGRWTRNPDCDEPLLHCQRENDSCRGRGESGGKIR